MNQTMREYSWGPTLLPDGTTRFRLWAPKEPQVSLRVGELEMPMTATGEGWFESVLGDQPVGSDYAFLLPSGDIVPDPASRSQADVLGPSRLVDRNAYAWKHGGWTGRPWEEAIFYEIHVGTFTPEGTFRAATDKLAYLADVGFTAVEIMPLAHFPGKRGWGYDGVFHYAPFGPYGSPDDFKAFVDAAHGCGLMVFLDVVYNHFGPEGNFLSKYAPKFFREGNPTPWGPRIAFCSEPVRRYFIENAVYWMTEYRLDGLRLDAIDQIEDDSEVHILEQLSLEVQAAVQDRIIHLITENPANGTDLMAERDDGLRLYKADWNDDFHHALHSAVTGEDTGYYEPLSNAPWENVAKALAQGHLQKGKRILRIDPPHPSTLPTACFIHFLQNHDQVGNRALGDRLSSMLDNELHAALTEMLVLSPQVPLFFQGDDHLSTRPFRFFADYEGDLRRRIWKDRETEALNFGGFPHGHGPDDIPDPSAETTFADCKLDWREAETSEADEWRVFLRRLLRVRADSISPSIGRGVHRGRVLSAPDRCVFVDWEYHGGILSLRANFSAKSVILDRDHTHEIYPGTNLAAGRSIHAHSVRVFNRSD